MNTPLMRTPLYDLHLQHGAKMVPFAEYEMPLQYTAGVMAEHLHTRSKAGLFDVSHMGQIKISPKSGHIKDAALALEQLIPIDIVNLPEGKQRYGFLTNDIGGILDDIMLAHFGEYFLLVVNAATKKQDLIQLESKIFDQCIITPLFDRALLALQGPLSEEIIKSFCPSAQKMRFMDVLETHFMKIPITLSRSGYTGEDGYEIGCSSEDAVEVAQSLLAVADVLPVGLGARDSLRLEAGLCLYGNDIDTETTPVEASLSWAIQKTRREGGERAGNYPGAPIIAQQLQKGVLKKRVGLLPEGKAPIRSGALLYADINGSQCVGKVTSGAFGPTLKAPVAMGYVATEYSAEGALLYAELRGRFVPVKVQKMPFVPAAFKR
ncbi:glycine cleavage system aminomethyltransferase GcvT [Swingsia samuiensis]|uniref:aminomethyltransferase n=1 Tax=Swingsia samuiensis TaxID=1293412 RepID=A0A4Y6UHE7_9PROT|nr:glycine cleavage system aminomethyltransferase GcvT [Swingsia samuiensis]QDH16932.1 glycine cleavage system aminomethyltransferase GcvT [Swingsia samuiensis]